MSMRGNDEILPPERAGRIAPPELVATRNAVAQNPGAYAEVPSVEISQTALNGSDALVLTPPEARADILYFHGGGYRMGEPRNWRGYGSVIAAKARARLIIPDYRLAPEHPFPAALHDGLTALRALDVSPETLFLAGDSAGGGLALSVTAAAIAAGHPMTAGTILLSPWLDVSLSGVTFANRSERDPVFAAAAAQTAADAYLQGHDGKDPLASPLFADARGLPPSLILTGTAETLLDDALRFARQAALADCSVTLRTFANMQHVWSMLAPDLPESRSALRAIAEFVDDRLD